MILEGKQSITKTSKIFHFTHWTLRKKLKLSKKSKMFVLWKRSLSTITYMKFKDKYIHDMHFGRDYTYYQYLPLSWTNISSGTWGC